MIHNAIKNIIVGEKLELILSETLTSIFKNGPISITDMEVLAYFVKYQPKTIEPYIEKILLFMGLFYKIKEYKPQSMKELVQKEYSNIISTELGDYYTPVQTSIIDGIKNNQCFSFSAPTSTGKSYVFRKLIEECENDVVVFVPSRALINEYYLLLTKSIPDKTINILTYVDKINTKKSKRNIFILTPERSSDLFKQANNFSVELFLFDEAQLGDEKNTRGLYYDSVIRRVQKYYDRAKCVFAQPFVANPEAQIHKNHFDNISSSAHAYRQRNVVQLFYEYDNKANRFYHMGIDISIMGNKFPIMHDPVEETLLNDGTILFYVSKSNIISDNVYHRFIKYINLCKDIDDEIIKPYQDRLIQYTGGASDKRKNYYSSSIALLKKGVVVHHGSLPLKMRSIIEDFTKAGLCRICFATSTLEQGINMPFDLVYIDKFEGSKPLSIKNLIGRSGRTTSDVRIDLGKVVIKSSNSTAFRKILKTDDSISTISLLESDDGNLGNDFDDFKESILNDSFMEEYNMTQKQYESLSDDKIQAIVTDLLNAIFDKDGTIIDKRTFYENEIPIVENVLVQIYESHLGRYLTGPEKRVLINAIHIILYRIYFGLFSVICKIRYNYLCRYKERKALYSAGKSTANVKVRSMMGYSDLPNLHLNFFNIVDTSTNAKDVDFDTIIYDTYDYIDKLIGFKLADIYYATFMTYYNTKGDERAKQFARLVKFGTSDEFEINLMRYGLSLDEVKMLSPYVMSVDSTEIVVKDDFFSLPEDIKRPLERFV